MSNLQRRVNGAGSFDNNSQEDDIRSSPDGKVIGDAFLLDGDDGDFDEDDDMIDDDALDDEQDQETPS